MIKLSATHIVTQSSPVDEEVEEQRNKGYLLGEGGEVVSASPLLGALFVCRVSSMPQENLDVSSSPAESQLAELLGDALGSLGHDSIVLRLTSQWNTIINELPMPLQRGCLPPHPLKVCASQNIDLLE